MTSIIVRRLRDNTFSLWGFWKRRAGRICPALLVLVTFVLTVGFFIQFPHLFRETSREGVRALLFISNFWFARDQGYFAEAVVDKTLLHTWSLSVEWQFYLLYPILLMLWGKFCSLKLLPHFVTALFAISLAASLLLPDNNALYFMLYSRAWELLIGGIIFLLPPLHLNAKTVRLLEITALIVIVLNIAIAPPMQGWEPSLVLPGVIACAALLWLNVEHSLLSNNILQYIGRISYSMYLIHWPVIAICSRLGLLSYFIPIILFIFIYSALSYHFIETKRQWHWPIIVLYLAVLGFAQVETSNKGKTPFNTDSELGNKSYSEMYYGGRDITARGNIYNGKIQGTPELVIAGDSYSRQYANFLNEKIAYTGVFSDGQLHFDNVFVSPDSKANPIKYSHRYYQNLINTLKTTAAHKVIIAHNWGLYLNRDKQMNSENTSHLDQQARKQAIAEGIIKLADSFPDKQFFIIGQTVSAPVFSTDCMLLKHSKNTVLHAIFKNLDCPKSTAVDFTKVDSINQYLQQTCNQRKNLHLIDPNPAFCQDGRCVMIDNKDFLTFSDGGHLSLSGGRTVGAYILKQIEDIAP